MSLVYFQESLCGDASMTAYPFTTKLQILPDSHQVLRPEEVLRQVLAKFLKILSKRDKSKIFTRIIFQSVIREGKNIMESLSVEITAAV